MQCCSIFFLLAFIFLCFCRSMRCCSMAMIWVMCLSRGFSSLCIKVSRGIAFKRPSNSSKRSLSSFSFSFSFSCYFYFSSSFPFLISYYLFWSQIATEWVAISPNNLMAFLGDDASLPWAAQGRQGNGGEGIKRRCGEWKGEGERGGSWSGEGRGRWYSSVVTLTLLRSSPPAISNQSLMMIASPPPPYRYHPPLPLPLHLVIRIFLVVYSRRNVHPCRYLGLIYSHHILNLVMMNMII